MAPAPRFLGTRPPCETRALICHKINIGVSVRQTGRQPGGYLSKWTQLGMILSDETCDVRESKSRYQAFPIEWDVRSPCKSSKQCHWHKNWKQWNLHYWESPHMQNPTKIGCIPGTWVFEHYFQELPLSLFLDTTYVWQTKFSSNLWGYKPMLTLHLSWSKKSQISFLFSTAAITFSGRQFLKGSLTWQNILLVTCKIERICYTTSNQMQTDDKRVTSAFFLLCKGCMKIFTDMFM